MSYFCFSVVSCVSMRILHSRCVLVSGIQTCALAISMQIDFYQLSREPVERVLPSIAQRILESGGRLLFVADEARLEQISQGLWLAAPETFLANGRAEEIGRASCRERVCQYV